MEPHILNSLFATEPSILGMAYQVINAAYPTLSNLKNKLRQFLHVFNIVYIYIASHISILLSRSTRLNRSLIEHLYVDSDA